MLAHQHEPSPRWHLPFADQERRPTAQGHAMNLMSPVESMMLLAESPGHPMHVAGLQLFQPPQAAGPEFVREYYEALRACDEVQPLFRKHPARLPGSERRLVVGDRHRTRLPRSALGTARSRSGQGTSRTDFATAFRDARSASSVVGDPCHRRLNDGRFAVYTKIHHGLVDGVAAINLLQGALSADALDQEVRRLGVTE